MRRHPSASLALLPLALLAACHNGFSNGYAVDLVLQLDPALKASAANIRTLELDTSGAETDELTLSPTALPSGAAEHVVYRPKATSGSLMFTATARAADGSDVAFGQGTATLHGGATTTLTITLGGNLPPAPDFAPPNPAMIAPETVTVARLTTQAFTAGVDVTWSVVEPDGGSIDSAGSYTAPGLIGTYHVRATLVADPTQHSTATVTVGFGGVQVVAGAPGGQGAVDGSGGTARFGGGEGMLTLDSAGNVYLADRSNQTVRKLTPAGAVTTIVGKVGQRPATADPDSQLIYDPYGVAVNAAGTTLYLAECSNHTVARVDFDATAQTWTRKLIAGEPGVSGHGDAATGVNATFNCPTGLALDETHNLLYVSDFNNHTIRYLALGANGASVGTVVGTAGTCGSSDAAPASFCSPRGLTIDPVTNTLYVADSSNATVRKVAVTLAGSPSLPSGATVTTLAGTAGMFGSTDGASGTNRFSTPIGVFYASSTTLYVTDSFRSGASASQTVRRVTLPGGAVDTLAGTAGTAGYKDGTTGTLFNAPSGIAALGSTAYVMDSGNYVVRKLSLAATTTVATFAGSPSQSGTALQNGAGTDSRFNGPVGLAGDGSGAVYLADSGNCAVRKLVVSGTPGSYAATVSTIAGGGSDGKSCGSTNGSATAALFSSPQALAFDGQHTLYVAEAGLRAIDLSTTPAATVGSVVGLPSAARGLAADFTSGTFYLSLVDNTIARYVAPTAELRRMWGQQNLAGNLDGYGESAAFTSPTALLLAGGALYVSDFGNATLRRVTLADAYVATVAGKKGAGMLTDGIGTAAVLGGSCGLATLPDGRIVFADESAHAVRAYDPATQAVTTLVGSLGVPGVKNGALPGGLSQPCGVALLPTGELLISDLGEQVVQLVY